MAGNNKRNCEVYLFGETSTMESGHRTVRSKGIRPVYKTAGAAAADLAVPERVEIKPHETVKICLNIGFEIPKGYCVKLYPRSSLLVKRGLIQPVSIIDQDYSGQKVHAPLHNLTDSTVVLEAGERVCQAMLEPYFDVVDWDHEQNERDPAGFGGSGRV